MEATGLAGAIGHDERFWRSAYDAHGPVVLAFLLRRVGRRDEAEDLLQETFCRAIDAGSFRRGSNLRAYLLRTARNLWINRLRRPRLVVSDEPQVDATLAEEAGGSAAVSPERGAAWSAFKDRLDHVLDEMKPEQRLAFELGVLQQRSYSEIASSTGWSLSKVKIKIHRARRRVIDELGDFVPDLGGSV